MKKKIAILGSTGSIGRSLINIIEKKKNDFEILLLTANKNYKELLKQTKKLKVRNVIITDKQSFKKFKSKNTNKNIRVFNNFKNLKSIFKKKTDYTMSSIMGLDGLIPTVKIIKYSKTIAIANKESIICGWNILNRQIKIHKTQFIPVDSEHFSIWYALKNVKFQNIDKIFITASGGPLLNLTNKKIKKIKIEEVLKHPNWKMGKKITVDSSTMMNKVFEVIEAKNIFGLNFNKINIIVHPQSYIHAIITYNDGMVNIIAHDTTMEIPIFNSLYENKNYFNLRNKFSIKKLNEIKFKKINLLKFPILNVLKHIPTKQSLFETVVVSANDELVKLYLNKELSYNEISKKLFKIIRSKEFEKFKKISPKKVSDIINLDKYVRSKINSKSI